ncbi:MFS transporter [Actinospica durhamensis]|uniref:MFS transporter n=1 Tax=Actinospica durhamensis TaxID=1508375 RepID=A0A941EP95_9ACTN|nr:MFS transporter [Actinospica durhamensis]MBR7834871.1 MFS transporter [Actinospica durhamensis]
MVNNSQLGAGTTPRRAATPGQVLLIVSAGVVLASLDMFIVNVALPRIAVDLHAGGIGRLSWVLNAYAIVYAALLVFFGRLADRYRRDKAFLLGVALFTLASAGCAASVDVGMLIGFRVLQAVGAALLTPTSLSLLLAAYPPQGRAGAVRAWTAFGGVAASLGPVVGGLLVAANWRLVFLVNVPLGLAALVAGARLLPRLPGEEVERPDPVGALLVTAGVGALTLGVVQGGTWGWDSPAIVTTLAAAAVLLAGLAAHTMRSRTPLIHPSLFASPAFTGSSVIAVFFSVGMGAMLLTIVLFLQQVWGWSALRAGLGIAPGPLMVPLLSFLVTGRLARRFGPGVTSAAGSVCFAAGVAWWALGTTATPDYAAGVLGGMMLTGVGVGLTLPIVMSSAAASLPAASYATGSAVVNMLRQTGLALGVAITVAILGEAGGTAAFHRAWWVTAAVSLAAVAPALTVLHRDRGHLPAPQPQPEAPRTEQLARG